MSHITDHIHKPQLRSDNTLYVVGVISNYVRYHSRYRIAREWIKAMEATPNVQLCLVETAFGDRHHEITEEHNPWHLQLRTKSEIWIKENMINLGVRHLLPKNWKYLAWIDMDVFFDNKSWALETIHQLQHHHVVQPWQNCIDLGPYGSILEHHKSFGHMASKGYRIKRRPHDPYECAHSGYAWACDRHFWENVGGLIDCAILGSADHHMAWALLNDTLVSVNEMMIDGFKKRMTEWQKRAYRVVNGQIGYVPGFIRHEFHGPKKRRYYRERWKILVDHKYDPDKDLMCDAQGLIQLIGKPKLEQAIRHYNRSRMEDSIEEF